MSTHEGLICSDRHYILSEESLVVCSCAPTVGITVGRYHFTDLAYADDAAILMSDQLQADSVPQSFNAFVAPLGLKLSWPKTKL